MPPQFIDLRQADDTRDVIHLAVQTLVEGKLVVFPTETVYGVGASALHAEGVARIYQAKGRESKVPLTLAIKSAEEALDYVAQPGRMAERLARRCWPGPITLVMDYLQGQGLVSQLPESVRKAVAPDGTLGLRVPAHQAVLDVLAMLTGPIALTSANRSGEPDAVTAQQAADYLGENVALVLDDGPCHYGQPSTVVRATENRYDCLREGVVGESALERLGIMIVLLVCTGNTCRSPMAEVLFRRLVAKKLGCRPEELDQRGVSIASAGLAAMPGQGASFESAKIMQEKGLPLDDHAAQPFSDKLVQHADIILTMTNSHRQAIVRRWPEAASRVQTLRPDGGDIDDPIGSPEAVYRQCAEQIEAASRQRVDAMEFI